jgi:hypothetical protein
LNWQFRFVRHSFGLEELDVEPENKFKVESKVNLGLNVRLNASYRSLMWDRGED